MAASAVQRKRQMLLGIRVPNINENDEVPDDGTAQGAKLICEKQVSKDVFFL